MMIEEYAIQQLVDKLGVFGAAADEAYVGYIVWHIGQDGTHLKPSDLAFNKKIDILLINEDIFKESLDLEARIILENLVVDCPTQFGKIVVEDITQKVLSILDANPVI